MSDRSGAPSARPRPLAQAQRLDAAAQPDGRSFTYSVLPPQMAATIGGERRGLARQRMRLRSGKLVRRDGQFICECLVCNRSPGGCRLRLPRAAPELDAGFYFYDDQSEQLFLASMVWHRDREIGVRLSPCPLNPLHRSIAGAMRRKFYALKR